MQESILPNQQSIDEMPSLDEAAPQSFSFSKQKMTVVSGIIILCVGIFLGYYLNTLQNKNSEVAQTESVNATVSEVAQTDQVEATVVPSEVVTPVPEVSEAAGTTTEEDPTVQWKTFTGKTEYGDTFTIKYPQNWAIKGRMLYPLGDTKADISNYAAPYVYLGAGGQGGGSTDLEEKTFPAGTASISWSENGGYARITKGNKDYIFHALYYGNPESLSNEEYRKLFELMLGTLKI